MNFIDDLKYKFKNATIVEKLIYINVAVYVVTLLFSSFSGLFQSTSNLIYNWFSLYSSTNDLLTKPWSIISYGFLHSNFLHLLFNCIWLYLFGRLFIDYFTQRQLLTFYLLGTFFGGVLFLFAMNYFPLFTKDNHLLVGASAGISAIIIGTATYIPNYQLKFRFIGYIKVWHLAAFFVLVDLIQLSGSNGGGHIAHIGGALFGFFYVYSASNKEITIFSSLKKYFTKKEKPLKTVYKSGNKSRKSSVGKTQNQQEIDAILDKISKSGYDALSKQEKEFLFKQGKK